MKPAISLWVDTKTLINADIGERSVLIPRANTRSTTPKQENFNGKADPLMRLEHRHDRQRRTD